jgi:hypothetical protein
MHRGVAWLVPQAGLCSALLVASPAVAQGPTGSSVSPPQDPPAPSGEPAVAPVFTGFALSAALRLSLVGAIVPMASMFPQCSTLEDDVGNSVGGIPVQHYEEWRATPRLVFSFFSSLGCPIDAGLGAAFTYSVPIRPSLALAFGAGLYFAPGQAPFYGGLASMPQSLLQGLRGGDTNIPTAGRVDLVWKGGGGRTYSVGAETLGMSKRRVLFSGGL